MSLSNFFDKLGWMLQIDSSGSLNDDKSSITIQAKHFYHWDGNVGIVDVLTNAADYEPAYHMGACDEWVPDVDFDEWIVGGPNQIEDHRTISWNPGEPRAFVSRMALIPKDECDHVIALCEKRSQEMGSWGTSSGAHCDMDIKELPEVLEWFNSRLKSTIFPLLAYLFPDKIKSATHMRANDAFVVKYDMEGQRALPLHVDEGAFTFTIALNDMCDYEGGGTRFEMARRPGSDEPWHEEVLNADAGGVVAFAGKVRHGGMQIQSGTRYIISAFSCWVDENMLKKESLQSLQNGMADFEPDSWWETELALERKWNLLRGGIAWMTDTFTTENLNDPAFFGNQITLKAGNTEKTYFLDNSGGYFTCNQLISNISDFEKLIRPLSDLRCTSYASAAAACASSAAAAADLINANKNLLNIHFDQLKLINPEEDVINHKYTPLWTSG